MPEGRDDKVGRWVPFYREFVNTRNVLILLACGLAVAIAVIIGLLLSAADAKVAMSGLSIFQFVAITLLLNAGFGIGVSLLISSLVLRDQRFEVQLDLDRRIDLISRNVFDGVLASKLPSGYAKLATRVILDRPMIRRRLNVKITMEALDDIDRSPRQRKFTLLKTSVTCRNENIGSRAEEVPIAIFLPNPIAPGAKQHVRLTEAHWTGGKLSEPQIAALNRQAQLQLADNSRPEIEFPLATLKVEANEGFDLAFSYAIVKEEEDNELILTALPTETITLSVNDKTGRGLTLLAKSIHTEKIGPDARPVVHDGWAEWQLDGWAFPRQGVIYWWKLPSGDVA